MIECRPVILETKNGFELRFVADGMRNFRLPRYARNVADVEVASFPVEEIKNADTLDEHMRKRPGDPWKKSAKWGG